MGREWVDRVVIAGEMMMHNEGGYINGGGSMLYIQMPYLTKTIRVVKIG